MWCRWPAGCRTSAGCTSSRTGDGRPAPSCPAGRRHGLVPHQRRQAGRVAALTLKAACPGVAGWCAWRAAGPRAWGARVVQKHNFVGSVPGVPATGGLRNRLWAPIWTQKDNLLICLFYCLLLCVLLYVYVYLYAY